MTIPTDVIKILETEIDGMEYGLATLTIHRRGSNIRFTIGRERSFLDDKYLKGFGESCSKNGKRES